MRNPKFEIRNSKQARDTHVARASCPCSVHATVEGYESANSPLSTFATQKHGRDARATGEPFRHSIFRFDSDFGFRISDFAAPRRGFTFIEVLFATIILGLGFIMIAAVFPAALQQGLTTADETTGTEVCRDALRQIQNIATDANLPYPGTSYNNSSPFSPMVPMGNFTFNFTVNGVTANPIGALGGNQFFSADRRFAWVAFYRRLSASDPMAQVIIVALKSNVFADAKYNIPPQVPPFTGYVGVLNSGNVHPQLTPITYPSQPTIPQPAIMGSFFYSQATGASYVVLPDATTYPNALLPYGTMNTWAGGLPYAPGCYVIVSDDHSVGSNTPDGSMIGRVFRLGLQTTVSALPSDISAGAQMLTATTVYQLEPGMDLVPGPGGISGVGPYSREETRSPGNTSIRAIPIYVVGVLPSYNSTDSAYDGPYVGGNQAVACVSAYVRINN